MSEYTTSRTTRYLPQVAVATTLVTIVPVVIVWLLLDEGVISSPWVCVGLAVALSLCASFLGNAYWRRRSGHGDIFFSELLLWGWLHRLRGERRLNSAMGRLALSNSDEHPAEGEASVERKAQLLRRMAAALDAQDPYTDGHSRRVALHSAMVARRMHLPPEEVARIRTAAAVHDIGKLRTPPEILNKPEPLTSDEFEIVKRHADDGAEIVSSMADPEITAMVRHHHERFDGGGYPAGLVSEATPVGARIIAVADTFDALTSVRPYRSAISHKRALDAIAAASGTQLDPVVVRTFLKCYSANRATVFWTLLAISPSRAIALLRGRSAGPGNLASAGTVAAPAVIAAAFGIALGSPASVLPRDPLAARKPPVPAAATKPPASRSRAHHAPQPALAALPATQAVLAASAARHKRTVSSHPRTSVGAVNGISRKPPSRPRGSGPKAKPHHPRKPPPHYPAPATPGPPPSSSGSPSSPPGATSNAPSGTPASGPAGGGAPGPSGLTKGDCKSGGFGQYGFSNQGQCVAFVERASH